VRQEPRTELQVGVQAAEPGTHNTMRVVDQHARGGVDGEPVQDERAVMPASRAPMPPGTAAPRLGSR